MILGPAGSGKTVLARHIGDARRAVGARLLWCRLTVDTSAPGEIAAMVRVAAGNDEEDYFPTDADALGLAAGLLDVMEAEPTVLVLEDAHHADATVLEPALAELASLAPDTSVVVLVTRRRPAVLLGRAPGLVAMTNTSDLAFTANEGEDLFALAGRDPDLAPAWVSTVGGWAAALRLASEIDPTPTPEHGLTTLVEALVHEHLDPAARSALEVLAIAPYLDRATVHAIGIAPDALERLADATALVESDAGRWTVRPELARAVVADLPADIARQHRLAVARAVAETDAPTAVRLLLDAGDAAGAADAIQRSLSTLPPDQVRRWLYELPAEVRRRFPSLAAGGAATVDVDEAVASAQERLAAAADEPRRREALLALGSAQLSTGDLPAAQQALEDLLAALDRADPAADRAAVLLGLARWWSDDLEGASDALSGSSETTWSAWLRGKLALAGGDTAAAAEWAQRSIDAAANQPGATAAPGESLQARAALISGDIEGGQTLARAALESAGDTGGHDLATAAVAVAWARLLNDDPEGAASLCDQLDRRVTRHDLLARVEVALLRRELARQRGDVAATERADRQVALLRQTGFAHVERVALATLDSATGTPPDLRVALCGSSAVTVDGTATGGWKSRKALEVLRYLAWSGTSGARREQVIEAVWPDRDPAKGRTLLRTALSEIRRTLEPGRPAGEPSRFLHVDGDCIRADATTDLDEARLAVDHGDPAAAWPVLGSIDAGALAEMSASEWAVEAGSVVTRFRLEVAERVAGGAGLDAIVRRDALEALIEAEPWQRRHVDALASLLRSEGDDAGAAGVERRWFEDDI